MKIIDLLNKIANGEYIPKTIKYKNTTYKDEPCYLTYEAVGEATEENFKSVLNSTIEIIEEDKEIELIQIKLVEDNEHYVIKEKINELIKAVNELKKEGNKKEPIN